MNRPSPRSIAVRLPLSMVVAMGALFIALIAIAHARVRQSVVEADAARLHSAAASVADALGPAVQRIVGDARQVLDSPAATRLATTGPVRSKDALEKNLREIHGQFPSALAVAYWRGGELVAFDGARDAAEAIRPPAPGAAANSPIRVGPILFLGDMPLYGTTTFIGPAGTSGSIVFARRVAMAGNRGLGSRLIDRRATVLLGNTSGTAWVRVGSEGAVPRVELPGDSTFEFTDDDGIRHLGAAARLSGTPWRIVVELPLLVSTAAADRTLGFMAGIGAVFLILAALVSWAIVSRFTRPIMDIADAAMNFSRGDYTRRVAVVSADEVGQVGTAFNIMADEVAASARDSADRATALEEANRALRESEGRYRALAEQSPDGIVVHRDFRILFGNAAAAKILGAPSIESLYGTSFLQFVVPDARPMIEARVRGIEQNADAPPLIHLEMVRADGSRLQAECSGMQLTIAGGPAVQTIVRDVTERVKLEGQMRQSQRMEAVGKLAGGVAHEFNNLLTIIQSYSEFATRGLATGDPRRSDIEEVRRAAMIASQLTRQLLAFSRQQVVVPQYIEVGAHIDEIGAMLSRLVGEQIRVDVRPAGEPSWIWADPGQMQQVLVNLALNARDAMPRGGRLGIRAARLTIDHDLDAFGTRIPPGEFVQVIVEDEGIGMNDEVKARAFEPFFTTKLVGQGTGLGLATVYGIVRQADGHIRLESAPGRGTCISLYFPRRAGAELPLASTGEFAIPRGRHVLLVDDDTAVRRALRRAMEDAGFVVQDAANAADAVSLFDRSRSPADILVTDMVMPGASGASLVSLLRMRVPNLPAIIISGYSEERGGEDWRLPEHCLFLEKPISPRSLVREVSRMLTGES